MDEKFHETGDEEAVLRRFRFAGQGGGSGGAVDPVLLAAYVDGTASPDDREAVERAMLADPSVLDAVRDLREAVGAAPPALPAGLIPRIREALGHAGPPAAFAFSSKRAAFSRWKMAVAAALVLFAGIAGYWLGQTRGVDGTAEEAVIRTELAKEWELESYEFLEVAWIPEE